MNSFDNYDYNKNGHFFKKNLKNNSDSKNFAPSIETRVIEYLKSEWFIDVSALSTISKNHIWDMIYQNKNDSINNIAGIVAVYLQEGF